MADSTEVAGGAHTSTRDRLIDEAVEAANDCRGASVGNPTYFVEMLAGCVSANTPDELTALECIRDGLRECARRQRRDRAMEHAAAAAAIMAETRR
jgi:hypothetical protein